MAEFRMQFEVDTLTSTTGITLVPKVGELTKGKIVPTSIELTYTASPVPLRVVGKVIDVCLEEK
jgi:hypothetical protein